jgi:hypothetical protein
MPANSKMRISLQTATDAKYRTTTMTASVVMVNINEE